MVASILSSSTGDDLCGSKRVRRCRAVVIEASSPLLPGRNPGGCFALFMGLILALHTPVWVALVFYKDKVWHDEGTESTATSPMVAILRFLSSWLLDSTPWIANSMLAVFLGVLFLCMGLSTMEVSKTKSK
mmetsp:Transcript_17547/g.43767  ORF Transcript_17547/g.43767 Transcript_17547/m.43767 type:complete len:131 (+) Transcript_17547:199-591(+)